MKRYGIIVWHGESRTLFYVVDRRAVYKPCVLETFYTREEAERFIAELSKCAKR